VVLGHGAGGGVNTPDLNAAVHAANEAGFTATLVEQPYRVAGRRSQPSASQLDVAWLAVVRQLEDTELPARRLVVGGRSAGARVACRTAPDLNVDAVLCLAFPVHPPGKADDPSKSRLSELDAVTVPVLVVQGEHDSFGRPPAGPNRRVVLVPGGHSFRRTEELERAISEWLTALSSCRGHMDR
jgi:predicted alpha/beta-hydrolase family hydrolase